MTYWNETSDHHLRFWEIESYRSYNQFITEINEEGYRGDKLQPSKVVYLGTCDMMNLLDVEYRWPVMHHTDFHPNEPFIALGTVGSGVPSMVRRLYAYIQNFGAPEYVYMTIPRFDGYEYVNKSGKCYNVSTRESSARFCHTGGIVSDEELNTWLIQLDANKKLNNPHNIRYMLEERFAFMETICKAYNIKLNWTFNLSDASIVVLYNNLPIFADLSEFMKESFVGLAPAVDHLYDRSIGAWTHKEIYNKFVERNTWNYNSLCNQADLNLRWLKSAHSGELIKGE
jgi:hypothetical protein